MTDAEIQLEIASQIRETLARLVDGLRAEAAGPGGPPAKITLGRVADAVQNVLNAADSDLAGKYRPGS